MNVEVYLENRRRFLDSLPRRRVLCTACLQPDFGCYCAVVKRFDPRAEFVILTHPIELKRRIATGRMSHLCLENSHFLVGQDYSNDARVQALLADPRKHGMMLYPGPASVNLTHRTREEHRALVPEGKTPLIFVIDGTWATARYTVRQSRNLHGLPRICFTPPGPSNFRVRKQPRPGCYSTIEAVHHTIELLGGTWGYDASSRAHDNLIETFDHMVERQLKFISSEPRRRRTLSPKAPSTPIK